MVRADRHGGRRRLLALLPQAGARGASTRPHHLDAVEIAAATSGHSIVVSGAAVIVAMAGLYVVQDATFASLATGAILVVAISVHRLADRPAGAAGQAGQVGRPAADPLAVARQPADRPGRHQSASASSRASGHPKTCALVVATLAVLALAAPALGHEDARVDTSHLAAGHPGGADRTADRAGLFPSQGETLQVVVKTRPRDLPAVRGGAAFTADRGDRSTGTSSPAPAPTRSVSQPTGSVAVLTLATPYAEGTPGNEQALDELRDVAGPELLDSLAGTPTGRSAATSRRSATTPSHQTQQAALGDRLRAAADHADDGHHLPQRADRDLDDACSTWPRSAAAFGVLTLVFQNTWAEGLLGFTSSGFVVDWIPLFMFVVLVGLSMDYHVFVLSRVREGIQRGLPPRSSRSRPASPRRPASSRARRRSWSRSSRSSPR